MPSKPSSKSPLRVPPEAAYAVGNAARLVVNAARAHRPAPDYVVFTLDGDYPDLPPPRNFLQQRFLPPVASLHDLGEQFAAVAGDGRVRGVVLHLRPLALSLAQLQALRGHVLALRAAGKRVVAWSHSLDTANYFVASAADEILLQPGAVVAPLGLRRRYAFLADALDRVGLRYDVVPISPYKSAGDMFTRTEMSDAVREMANWLIETDFQELVAAIADGRGVSPDRAREIIDQSPYTDLQALGARVVDAVVGEEDLPTRLGDAGTPARLAAWEQCRRHLLLPRPPRGGRHVALIRIEGLIVDGHSEQPPMPYPVPMPLVGGARAGDLTVVQDARAAQEDDQVAAVVVYIDSPGGSATASEAISAALARLAEKKPVVAVMGPVAASGGYYVATPARWIVAQPSTLTGSIGVVSGKFVSAGLLDRMRLHRETLTRGQRVRDRRTPLQRRGARPGLGADPAHLRRVPRPRRRVAADHGRRRRRRRWRAGVDRPPGARARASRRARRPRTRLRQGARAGRPEPPDRRRPLPRRKAAPRAGPLHRGGPRLRAGRRADAQPIPRLVPAPARGVG